MLVQWVCLGRIVFGVSAPEEAITTAIEFTRLADMCSVTGMESLIAEHIKAIILANPAPKNVEIGRIPDTNTYCLTSEHITSAARLPERHPVRGVLATASVEGYLRQDSCKFLREISEVPGFSVDLLRAVKATLESIYHGSGGNTFEDPISGLRLKLGKG
jgi:hypothetical protein